MALKSLIIILAILLFFTVTVKAKIRVAVIDSGYSDLYDVKHKPKFCENGLMDFTETDINDNIEHGTHIINLIANNNDNIDYCIILFKFINKMYDDKTKVMIQYRNILRFLSANHSNFDILNMSLGGKAYSSYECSIIKYFLDLKKKVIIAAGNSGESLDVVSYYPANCDNRAIVVGSINFYDKTPTKYSNFGSIVDRWVTGELCEAMPYLKEGCETRGTSVSTAIVTGETVYDMYKKSLK